MQERAQGPLSPRQVWWGSDFTRRRGSQKRCFFACLSVRHAHQFLLGNTLSKHFAPYFLFSRKDLIKYLSSVLIPVNGI